ncbi:hypothetical protein JCM21714_2438 [Gracilibacillus boraciitolerans JCM 21714]|uniref:Sulfurtransferase n=1 Tax=Gracilibacillus boraciitolerans JCM 21714 TaxID=1298598 RepID=W4VJM3_9BACI|nr:hypothetical protein [Gracilibacillus boraciitolerans]GAE93361.1 hypothetical protein JCM21714_2438 [Gracilibacillus boraciitolerans JCM 21714]
MSIIWSLVIVIIVAITAHLIYTRYIPIKGIPCLELNKMCNRDKVTLDIRDYQQAAKDHIEGAMVLPVPYLRRYYSEIPSQKVYVIASNHLEKNIAIRFLTHKGFHVIGYTLTECKCKKKIEQLA